MSDAREQFTKEFFRRAYDCSLAMHDAVFPFKHRAFEGLQPNLDRVRLHAYHSEGDKDQLADALIELAAQCGRNYRLLKTMCDKPKEKKHGQENQKPG